MYRSYTPLIVGLMASAAVGFTAAAQEVPAPAQPQVSVPAPTPPQTSAPVADPAAQAAPAVQAAVAPPEPPPTLPTTGDGAIITTLLTNVCRPMVEGRGNFQQLVKAAGMTKDRRSDAYIKPLGQRPFQVEILPSSGANKNVCEMKVRYAPGYDEPIVDAMNKWRFLHDPQMRLKRNDIGGYKDAQRTTTTWDNWENQGYDGKMVGLILVQLNKPDGSAINTAYDEAEIKYSQRAALPPEQAQAPLAAQQPANPPAQPAS